ncbi:gluconate 2-dehydrogenase subunit 3 family protein [Pseudemcibacter aquimaris]|uniref:gluconate 2-dehydrogenase subunit 3 family protein n=1 Tax=Pseudemcibacter aquimaris TaxID=2857064 RepID=UPI0020115423|nr:gluconate 2-dehydrogenase subunit 3 family protein [Pseudemcibacter aquimaris]MCC3860968.1 gluconate 2-dehydrogenase subunit 3 family protein [Pseudemcibacter aquimaris]WDU59786.1 gluconate 2-dehydrogenase subunit 3 family protein [Pseudemcibacter aquimaris]
MTHKLNRRTILERMAMVTGGAISLTIVAACDGGVSVPDNVDGLELKALNEAHLNLIGDIADMIIPDTDTLGAKSVNVHYLIDELAANWMTADEKVDFLAELTRLDENIKAKYGMTFSELDQEGRGRVLDSLGLEMLASSQGGQIPGSANIETRKHIYLELRELIIFGYYTSEVGASEELNYDPVPGEFKGCIPLESVDGKAWST